MRYYHILALGLFTLFTSCRMYEDMPSGDNYVSTAIAKDDPEPTSAPTLQ